MGHIAYDPKDPVVDESAFINNANWRDFYGEVEEELAPNMPEPQGNLVYSISAFVNANESHW